MSEGVRVRVAVCVALCDALSVDLPLNVHVRLMLSPFERMPDCDESCDCEPLLKLLRVGDGETLAELLEACVAEPLAEREGDGEPLTVLLGDCDADPLPELLLL